MEWLTLLLFAACPLIMIFCMKGMFSGKKKETSKSLSLSDSVEINDIQSLKVKMADLMEQNERLTKEVDAMKEAQQFNQVPESHKNRIGNRGIS